MHARLAGVILLAAALSACSKDTTPTSPSTTATPTSPGSVRISGRILDYTTGLGVASQPVRWWAGSDSRLIIPYGTLMSTTDATGRFTVDVPVTDTFVPLADRLLFEIPETSGSIAIPAKSFETTIYVNPGTCNVRYGYVYDAVTYRPIAGAQVSRRNVATTDANGFYRLAIVCDAPQDQILGIGTTTLGASHPAYQGTYELDGRAEWTARPFIRRVDFALKPLP